MNVSDFSWPIPLQFIREGIPLIVLPTFVNGNGPFSFILDTGNATAPFILSRRIAEQLGVETASSWEFQPPSVVGSNPTELLAATVRSISVGPLSQEHARVGVSKAMDQLSRAIGREIDGNIGFPFLKDLRITLNYPNEMLILRAGKLGTEDWKAFDFELGQPKPLVLFWAKVKGVRFRFALDTGAGSTVVSNELAEQLALTRGEDVPMHGAGGAATGTFTQLPSLEFGNVSLRNVTAVTADVFAPLRNPVGGELDGIIGYNVMRQFCITVDYPMKRMRFE